MARLTDEQIAELDPEVLRKAMRAFDEMGWGQGQELCRDGSVCAVGAVQVGLGLVPVLEEDSPNILVPVGYPKFPQSSPEDTDGDWFFARWRTPSRERQQDWLDGARNHLTSLNYAKYVELLDEVVIDRELRWYDDGEEGVVFHNSIVEVNDGAPQSEGRQRVEAIFAEAITRIEAAKSAVNNKENASV